MKYIIAATLLAFTPYPLPWLLDAYDTERKESVVERFRTREECEAAATHIGTTCRPPKESEVDLPPMPEWMKAPPTEEPPLKTPSEDDDHGMH